MRFDHWRVSPWRSPVVELQATKPRLASCLVCSDPEYNALAEAIWSNYRDK
jgi:hypothetical protein